MNSDLGHSAASASEASTTPLSREHADAIQRMPYVRACLLEYANRPEDSTAIEAVKAIAAQVQSLAASTPALPNGWSIKDAAYVAECLDGKWGDGMQVGSTDAGARFIRAVLATPGRSSADTARPGSDEQDAPASPAPPQGEREAFEEHLRSREWPESMLWRQPDGNYVYAQSEWLAWQARASLSASTPSAVSAEARDAARYRWLRSDDIEVAQGQREIVVQMLRLPFREDQSDETLTGPELDAAVDAAMAPPAAGANHE